MANDSSAITLLWDANTEPDLAGYTVYWGNVPGIWRYTVTTTTTPGLTITSQVGSFGAFDADGIWYFAIDAFDSSGNHSTLTPALTKRIVRVPGYLKRRK